MCLLATSTIDRVGSINFSMSSFVLAPCTNGDIRLRGGRNRFEGRVEICINNQWGTVCDDAWGTTDANVACKQLGFASTGIYMKLHVLASFPGYYTQEPGNEAIHVHAK